jgi:hypothetical protein
VLGLSAFVWQHDLGAAYVQQPVVVTDRGAEQLSTHPLDPIHLARPDHEEPNR